STTELAPWRWTSTSTTPPRPGAYPSGTNRVASSPFNSTRRPAGASAVAVARVRAIKKTGASIVGDFSRGSVDLGEREPGVVRARGSHRRRRVGGGCVCGRLGGGRRGGAFRVEPRE